MFRDLRGEATSAFQGISHGALGYRTLDDFKRRVNSLEAKGDVSTICDAKRRHSKRIGVVPPFDFTGSAADCENGLTWVLVAVGDKAVERWRRVIEDEILHLNPSRKLVAAGEVLRRLWRQIFGVLAMHCVCGADKAAVKHRL